MVFAFGIPSLSKTENRSFADLSEARCEDVTTASRSAPSIAASVCWVNVAAVSKRT